MLLERTVSMKGRLVLLLGNGPSSWWATHLTLAPLRCRHPDLVVVACNLTGPRVGADLTFAVDRAMIEALLLGDSAEDGGPVACLRPVLDAVLRERSLSIRARARAIPVDDPPEGTGSGLAAFRAIAGSGPDAVVLAGFDGMADPRTRWQGECGYRAVPSNPALLGRWLAEIRALASQALLAGAIGAYAGPSGRLEPSPAAPLPRARLREAGALALAVAARAIRQRQEAPACLS